VAELKTLEEAIEAISVLAQAHVDLETVVKSKGELIERMDARIRLQQTLIDHDHAILVANGLAKPRPKKDLLPPTGGRTHDA
jgi:hypothetical protein